MTIHQTVLSLLGAVLLSTVAMGIGGDLMGNTVVIACFGLALVNAFANFIPIERRRLWFLWAILVPAAFVVEVLFPSGGRFAYIGRGSIFNQYFELIAMGSLFGGFFLMYRAKVYSALPAGTRRAKLSRFIRKTGLTWAGVLSLMIVIAAAFNLVWAVAVVVIALLLTLSYAVEEIRPVNPRAMRWIQRGIPPLPIAACILLLVHVANQDQFVLEINEYSENSRGWLYERRQDPVPLQEEVVLALGERYPTIFSSTSLSGLVTSMFDHTYASPASSSEPCPKCGGNHAADAAWSARAELTAFPTTPEAYTALIEGRCDIVVAFHPSEEEMARADAAGVPFRLHPVGREAFVFFVNESNPVEDLPAERIRDIYAGRVTNWRELGGNNERIIPYQRRENSGSQSRMMRFMRDDELMAAPLEHNIFDMGGIVSYVDRYHNYGNAIGYSFRYFIDHMVDSSGIKVVKVDGVAPTLETIQDGSYPLLDDIYMVTTEKIQAGIARPHRVDAFPPGAAPGSRQPLRAHPANGVTRFARRRA